MHVLPISGDDEQGVVDPHTETEHDGDGGGEVGNGDHVAEKPRQRGAETDAGEGDPDRQPHGEHRPEGEDQDDDGEGDSEELRAGHLELGEDLTADLDLEPFDLRHQPLELGADGPRLFEGRLPGDPDLGVGDPTGLGPLGCDLLRPFGGVGADQGDALDLGRSIEELGHGRLDFGVGDTLLGAEHDRPPFATHRRSGEVLVEDVETTPALHVGKPELGAVGGADDGVGEHPTEDEDAEPGQGHLAPIAEAPTPEVREQTDSHQGCHESSDCRLLTRTVTRLRFRARGRQSTAAFISAPSFFSTAGVHSTMANTTGHIGPSSSMAASSKPNTA